MIFMDLSDQMHASFMAGHGPLNIPQHGPHQPTSFAPAPNEYYDTRCVGPNYNPRPRESCYDTVPSRLSARDYDVGNLPVYEPPSFTPIKDIYEDDYENVLADRYPGYRRITTPRIFPDYEDF